MTCFWFRSVGVAYQPKTKNQSRMRLAVVAVAVRCFGAVVRGALYCGARCPSRTRVPRTIDRVTAPPLPPQPRDLPKTHTIGETLTKCRIFPYKEAKLLFDLTVRYCAVLTFFLALYRVGASFSPPGWVAGAPVLLGLGRTAGDCAQSQVIRMTLRRSALRRSALRAHAQGSNAHGHFVVPSARLRGAYCSRSAHAPLRADSLTSAHNPRHRVPRSSGDLLGNTMDSQS